MGVPRGQAERSPELRPARRQSRQPQRQVPPQRAARTAGRRQLRHVAGRGRSAAGPRLRVATRAPPEECFRWTWLRDALPLCGLMQSGLIGPGARHKSNKYQRARHLRRRNAGRFLSPIRFALRMSRRTGSGSRRHSNRRGRYRQRNREKKRGIVTNRVPPEAARVPEFESMEAPSEERFYAPQASL